MPMKPFMILALLLAGTALSACGPAIGAGAAIAADEYSEEERGEDLF